jgi:metallophosphoesterase (TIGR03767 family)
MRQLRVRAGRLKLVFIATGTLAFAVGVGTTQAGSTDSPIPDMRGSGLSPGEILGDYLLDANERHCPARLERAGVCEHEDHDSEPQDDFRPYGGTDSSRAESGNDRLSHSHPHSSRGADSDHARGRTIGLTTIDQTIAGEGDPDDGFQTLKRAGGEPRIVREELARAKQGRANRRRSLLYVAQTTDWQLVDEESPSRVEFLDIAANEPFPNTVSAAWRPQEAFGAYAVEQSVRQINEFADASPLRARGGSRAAMDMILMTGDQADNQQLNETDWVVRLLEGGPLDPNSGTDPSSCPVGQQPSGQTADPELYAGVQDYDDYFEGKQFYDPDRPIGPKYEDWPEYPGLMDRAQVEFVAQGFDVPSYVVLGNHDALAQGNQKAILPFEQVGVGCLKPLVPATDLTEVGDILDPAYLSGLAQTNPSQVMLVPPDERRQYVDRIQYKERFDTGFQDDAHGFGLVDPEENDASDGAATYYAFDAKPGIRMIALETNCDGGVTGPSAAGNIDDPQFQWLRGELERAERNDQLVVVYGHHPIRSLTCDIPDETPPPCTVEGQFGHDINAGCDRDPRDSSPLHLGEDLTALFHEFPHVITYVAGHTHENSLNEFVNPSGGAGDFWGIETASLIDWPPQNRLIELMDNCDGTLSIFGTTIDSAAPATAPASGTQADGLEGADLASISRTLAYNDPQAGFGTGEGEPNDRNVELLLDDPRRDPPDCKKPGPDPPRPDPPGDDTPRDDHDGNPSADSASASGSLPFTGLALGGLLLVALGLLASGSLSRWFARRSS